VGEDGDNRSMPHVGLRHRFAERVHVTGRSVDADDDRAVGVGSTADDDDRPGRVGGVVTYTIVSLAPCGSASPAAHRSARSLAGDPSKPTMISERFTVLMPLPCEPGTIDDRGG
jgi:hypothetical protein